MARQTTTRGFPYYQTNVDEPDGAEQQQDLAEVLEENVVLRKISTLATRGAATLAGLAHHATDFRVVSFSDGTSWLEPQLLTFDARTTGFTFQAADAGRLVEVLADGDLTATVPTNASVPFPIGTMLHVERMGSGEVTIAPQTVDVVIRSEDGKRRIASRYTAVYLRKRDVNEWVLVGALKA